jgi:hypothetical protein
MGGPQQYQTNARKKLDKLHAERIFLIKRPMIQAITMTAVLHATSTPDEESLSPMSAQPIATGILSTSTPTTHTSYLFQNHYIGLLHIFANHFPVLLINRPVVQHPNIARLPNIVRCNIP